MSGLFGIGEAPGPEECERGDPFVGRSGEWINTGLGGERRVGPSALRLWPQYRKPSLCLGCPLYEKGQSFVPGSGNERVFLSNVRKCVAEDETPEEKAASIAHCTKAYLGPELERLKPSALLLIGEDALHAVTGLRGSQKFHLSTWHRAEIDEIRLTLGATALPLPDSVHTLTFTLHPAFAMRMVVPQLKPSITTAVARARRWSERQAGPSRNWEFQLDPSVDDLIAYLDTNDDVAVDVETPEDAHHRIIMVGVSSGEHALVAPWSEEVAEVMREFLARQDVLKTGHNIAFDRHAFGAYGINMKPPIWNTIEAASLLNPPFKQAEKMRWLNLPACALRMIDGIPNWKDPERPETKAWYRAAFPKVNPYFHPRLYCGVDVVVTRLLKRAQREALAEMGML